MIELKHTRCERCPRPRTAQWIVDAGGAVVQICDGCVADGDRKLFIVSSEAWKTELMPTPEQVTSFLQHCGLDRYVYNWALEQRRAWWDANKHLPKAERAEEPNSVRLSVRWTKEHPEWSSDLCRNTVTFALKAVDAAFTHFFRRLREHTPPYGFPRFKKRGRCRDSFSVQVQDFDRHAQPRSFKLGKIGMIRTTEYMLPMPQIRTNPKHGTRGYLRGIVNRIVVSRAADRWYAAIMYTRIRAIPTPIDGPVLGVDLGINNIVTTSEFEWVTADDRLERSLKRLRRMQRKLARQRAAKPTVDAPDSGEYHKQVMRVAKLHKHVADARERDLHNLSHRLATTSSVIVTEDFNVRDLSSRKGVTRGQAGAQDTRRRIMSVGMGELRRQIAYKAAWYGSKHVTVDGATDQTCSDCGARNEHMRERRDNRFNCTSCGYTHTRQGNTARLLARIGRGDPPGVKAVAE